MSAKNTKALISILMSILGVLSLLMGAYIHEFALTEGTKELGENIYTFAPFAFFNLSAISLLV